MLPDDVYIEITRDLIIHDGSERDRIEKLNKATFKVLQMVQNKKLYCKKDQEAIEDLFFKVQEKQNKEDERRERQEYQEQTREKRIQRGSISALAERRQKIREQQLESRGAAGRAQLERMRRARNRNVTW